MGEEWARSFYTKRLMHPDMMHILAALRALSDRIDGLVESVKQLGEKVDAMQEEWREDESTDEESEEESDSVPDSWLSGYESEPESVESAPATFSYKVQRTC